MLHVNYTEVVLMNSAYAKQFHCTNINIINNRIIIMLQNASLTASLWPKPVVVVPCLSWTTASSVFTQVCTLKYIIHVHVHVHHDWLVICTIVIDVLLHVQLCINIVSP